MSEDARPLRAFYYDLDRLKKPGDVVEGLHDALQQVDEFRGIYNVFGTWYVSRVITDPALISDENLFLQHAVPQAFRTEYFDALRFNGPSITQQLARHRTAPFTLTEALRFIQPTGEDSWVISLLRRYGMRDALFCPFGRWVFAYWTPRPVTPGRFERQCLSGAAYLAATRIDRLVPRPERYERNGVELTKREIEVLRLAASGLTQSQIAIKLEISPRTAEHHIEKAIIRMGAKNITEACVQAVRYKFFA